MIALYFGSIPMGADALTGPTARSVARQNTFAQHDVTRGKPVLQDIGSELETQTFDFFFSEEFCDPEAELRKLELAFSMRTPLPLLFTAGGFSGQRFVVETLDIRVQRTDVKGRTVRVEASIGLIEAPVSNLLGLVEGIARAVAPALSNAARNNPNVRR